MSRSRLVITYTVLAAWLAWIAVSVGMLMSARADAPFISLYAAYVMLSAVLLGLNRRDLLAPTGLFVLAGFLAFGLNLPLIYIGNRAFETSDVTSIVISDQALFKVLVIFLVAQAAFVAGAYSRIYRAIPLQWLLGVTTESRKASIMGYFAVAAIVVVAGVLRLRYHLGEAGIQPSIAYAGEIQYILFDGTLLLCAWFIAQALRQSRMYVAMGLSLLLMVAITQALLSWRGGIAQIGTITLGLFWYQTVQPGERSYSLVWLAVLPLLAGTIIQIGNETRFSRLGGEQVFASSTGELIEKLAYRSQGTTRLAAVADYVGPLTLFNHGFIKTLHDQGLTTTTFIDRKLYAVAETQSHSVGTSGPGGPYLALGLFGVAGAYLLLGALYQGIYTFVSRSGPGANVILATALYSYLIFTLQNLLSENFGVTFLKNMVAVVGILLIIKAAVMQRPRRSEPAARASARSGPAAISRGSQGTTNASPRRGA